MGYVKPIVLGWLRRFDVSKTLFVGVGRSPAPFTTYLEGLVKFDSNIKVLNLPFSRHWTNFSSLESHRLQIKKHFDEFLPVNILNNDLTVVFIDYSNSGQALKTAAVSFAIYLEDEAVQPKIHLAVIEGGYFESKVIPYDLISLPSPMNVALENKEFSNYAQFGRFHLSSDGQYTKPEPQDEGYDILRHFMADQISKDSNSMSGETAQEIAERMRSTLKSSHMGAAVQMPYLLSSPNIGMTPRMILDQLRAAGSNGAYLP